MLERWLSGNVVSMFLETFVCLLTALVCGLVVGLERERLDKPAGVRTHILVSLGAAGFVHLGVLGHELAGLGTLSDFGRLVQSIAMGIGFLGAGAIFRGDSRVTGVTTAASIWVMGAVGAAAGAGAVLFALLLTVFAYVALRWLRFLDTKHTK